MVDVKSEIEEWVKTAGRAVVGDANVEIDPMVRPAEPAHGDYQANLAMRLGKELKKNPRQVATEIQAALLQGEGSRWLSAVDVAGPGFLNLKLNAEFVNQRLANMSADARLGVPEKDRKAQNAHAEPGTVVVDYSSPNLAKEMHIGHLRSTIIGDAIARVLSFMGDQVIRQNHLGDWGTQFGMLLEHLLDTGWQSQGDHSIGDLNLLYQAAKARFDADTDFQGRARRRVVSLQAGEPAALELWRGLIDESVRHMNDVYEKLGVLLQDGDIRPESFYNPKLPSVVSDLKADGIVSESQSAMVAFPPGFKNKEGEPLPLIVQKSDGGYGYATTDLAAGRFRVKELGATRIIIVADARQSEHFQMVFSVLRQAQWVPQAVRLEHVAFGTIQGADRKPFATRTGGTVRLVEVLDEAITRARAVLDAKGSDISEAERASIANAVGVGAVKYADLSNERVKDYVFDYERMLALEGNTAPYLQNAYVRIQSIFRKGGITPESLAASAAVLNVVEPAERALALRLFQLPAVLQGVSTSLEPHRLCTYLYELAAGFHTFYEQCRVLNATEDHVRQSRLLLCDLVGRTLKLGLNLLGIEAVPQM